MESPLHSVASLQAEVAAIQGALAREELEPLPQMLSQHDLHLREFCAGADAKRFKEELRQLQAMQMQAIAQMRQFQQKLKALMQTQRRSGHAARAYVQGGLS